MSDLYGVTVPPVRRSLRAVQASTGAGSRLTKGSALVENHSRRDPGYVRLNWWIDPLISSLPTAPPGLAFRNMGALLEMGGARDLPARSFFVGRNPQRQAGSPFGAGREAGLVCGHARVSLWHLADGGDLLLDLQREEIG